MTIGHILLILRARYRVILLTLLATIAAAVIGLLVVPSRYDVTASAIVDLTQPDLVTGQTMASPFLRIQQGNLISLVTSRRVALDVVHRLNLTQDPDYIDGYKSSGSTLDLGEWIADQLLIGLDAKFGEASNVMTITYRSRSPIAAALVANTFLTAFLGAAVELKVAPAEQIVQWYTPQISKLRDDVATARQKLDSFRSTAQILSQSQGADVENSQLKAIGDQLATSKGQLLMLQAQLSSGDTGEPDAVSTATGGAENQTLVTLKQTLADTDAKLGRARSELGSSNPTVVGLAAARQSLLTQIKAEQASYRDSLNLRVQGLKAQVAKLQEAQQGQSQKVIVVQSQRDQLDSLTRDVDFHQQQLDAAIKSAASAQLQSQQSFANISALDHAVPPSRATFPKKSATLAVALFLGLFLGCLLALLAEAFDRRLRNIADLEFATELPLLGTLLPSSGRVKGAKSFS
jgi:polysaccharide biosynthesis transport protein